MRVCMRVQIGGFRNGVEWPPVGGVIDVPDHEGRDLVANGYARQVGDDGVVVEDVPVERESPMAEAIRAAIVEDAVLGGVFVDGGDDEGTDGDAGGESAADGDVAAAVESGGVGAEDAPAPAPRPRGRGRRPAG